MHKMSRCDLGFRVINLLKLTKLELKLKVIMV